MKLQRSSGVVLHPTLLPARLGATRTRSSTGSPPQARAGGRSSRSARRRPARRTRPRRRSPPGMASLPTRNAPLGPGANGVPPRECVLDRRLDGAAAASPTKFASTGSGRRCAPTQREQGVRLIGDIPIYVAQGSVDHRTHPQLFLPGPSPGRRRTSSGRSASTGATRSSTGTPRRATATAGGSSASGARSRSSTSPGSTTSAASPSSGRSRRARLTRAPDAGCPARARRCSGRPRPSSAPCR